MAVGKWVDLYGLRRSVNGGRLWEGWASVTGDATGGLATCRITLPQEPAVLWKPLRVFVRGNASTEVTVYVSGMFTDVPGASFETAWYVLTCGANKVPPTDQLAALLKAIGYLWSPVGLAAAGQPYVELSMGNIDTTAYKLGLTFWEVPIANERKADYRDTLGI